MGIGSAVTDNASYRPFVEDGKSWVVTYSYAHGWLPPFKAECYYIDGDTLVGSQVCKKLMHRVNDIENKSIATSLDKLIYEQDRKVYYYPARDAVIMGQPILLYDFSACPGDTLSLGGMPDDETWCFKIWDTTQLTWGGGPFNGQLATVYDPARGLFWNYSENKVTDIVEVNKTVDSHIRKYCKESRPKIGWEGEKNPNHFQLFEQIYTNEFHISKDEVRDLLAPDVLERMIAEVKQNFRSLMSVNRVTLICKCLVYRFNELRKLL